MTKATLLLLAGLSAACGGAQDDIGAMMDGGSSTTSDTSFPGRP